MTLQIGLLFFLIAGAIGAFVSEKVRPDLVALVMLLALIFTSLVTPQQAFAGLSSPAIILLIAVYIMTGALFRTGVSGMIGRWLVRTAGENETRLVAMITLASAGLSLFMNNIASGAVLMPAIMDVTRRTRINPSRLMMPMAYGTMLGGMATLFTTSNLVASGVLINAGYKGFGVFDFLTVGGPIALAGVLYMTLIGRKLLPNRHPIQELAHESDVDLESFYQIQERLHEIRLLPSCTLVGKSLSEAGIGHEYGLTVMAIERSNRMIFSPLVKEVLRVGDILLISGRNEMISMLEGCGVIIQSARRWPKEPVRSGMDMVEVLPAPHSSVLGKSIIEMQFRNKYGLNVIAMWRGGRSYRTAFSNFPIQGSEVLLVYGPRQRFNLLQNDPDWLVLQVHESQSMHPEKMRLALAILAISLMAASVGLWPPQIVMFIGALAMILTGCLQMDQVYQAIDWRSIFLIAGMLPIGLALTNTGASAFIGRYITGPLGQSGWPAMAAGLFIISSVMNQFIPGGSAIPAMLTPIAITAAQSMNADPHAFALIVAISSGTSMLTPVAHPVNVLVMGPGDYRFSDYLRVGLPLVLITFVMTIILTPIFWGRG